MAEEQSFDLSTNEGRDKLLDLWADMILKYGREHGSAEGFATIRMTVACGITFEQWNQSCAFDKDPELIPFFEQIAKWGISKEAFQRRLFEKFNQSVSD